MIHNTDTKTLLYRVRLLLEEGRREDALAWLETIQPEDEEQKRQVAYLRGWEYIQGKQWNAALEVLSPLLDKSTNREEQDMLLDRERLAHHLLQLGMVEVDNGCYEDASIHFTLCIKVLHDRRVHLPTVRIQARYSLAMTCLVRGLLPAAIQHYEEALRLCHHYDNNDYLADIQHGLCDTYRRTGDFLKANSAGQEALRLYELAGDGAQQARMHNMLGRIDQLLGYYKEASDHFTESLALATLHNGPLMMMVDCAALADLRLAEGRIDEAKRYCHIALETLKRCDNPHMAGSAYHVVAKVTTHDAMRKEGKERTELLEEALTWYQKASEQMELTQAYSDIAVMYGDWANALEELGRSLEAIECWRLGYDALSQAKGTSTH